MLSHAIWFCTSRRASAAWNSHTRGVARQLLVKPGALLPPAQLSGVARLEDHLLPTVKLALNLLLHLVHLQIN